jgi:ADP-ribose pyrophosphatase YjhB (NUDIX family)
MDIATVTRQEVRRRLERLRDEYGSFPIREKTVTNDPDFFESGVRLAENGWIGDAGAFVTDERDRALLIRHEASPDTWGVPGGGHEPGETMEETARREVHEETNIQVHIDDVAYARRKTIVHEADPDRRLFMLTVVFDATPTRAGVPDIGDDEVLDARWFEEPPDGIDRFHEDRIERWASSGDE